LLGNRSHGLIEMLGNLRTSKPMEKSKDDDLAQWLRQTLEGAMKVRIGVARQGSGGGISDRERGGGRPAMSLHHDAMSNADQPGPERGAIAQLFEQHEGT